MRESTIQLNQITDEQRARNAYWISVVTAVLMGIVLIFVLLFSGITSDTIAGNIGLLAGILASITGAVLSRRGHTVPAIILIITTFGGIVISRVFTVKGEAIFTGVIHIVMITTIAVFTLRPKWIGRVIAVAFLVASSTIIADQFTRGLPASSNPAVANRISLFLGLIFLIILLAQFPRFSLRPKLIIGSIALIALPVISLSALTFNTTRSLLETQAKTNILDSAFSTSLSLQEFATEQFNLLKTEAQEPEFLAYMGLSSFSRKGSQQESAATEKLISIARISPTYVTSHALVDLNGEVLLDTNADNIGANYGSQDFFNVVVQNQKPYAMAIPNANQSINLYFAVPMKSRSGDITGVYVTTYNNRIIQTILEEIQRANPAATTEFTYLIEETNFFILANSDKPEVLNKSILSAGDPRVAALQQQGLLNPENVASYLVSQPEIMVAISNMENTASFRAPSPEINGEPAESAAVRILDTNWVVVTAEPVSAIDALTQTQTRWTIVISIGLISLAAILALVIANIFSRPIIELTRVAENVSAGDFTQKSNIKSRDEIGVLAGSFNKMTDEIQQLIGSLESRVNQRTAELARATEQSEKRARDFQAISEIARTISTEKDLEKLLPLVTQIVSERFGFYHVGIFLLDELKKFAILRAANSAGGKEMLNRQHRLEVGQTGIVGNVTGTGKPRIALDTGKDAVFFNNPNLPDTRSEMALPLTARGEVIGALDVQSTIPNAFLEADISILSLLADQISIAIDNVRLIGETQNALAESQAILTEYVSESWRKRFGSGVLGYHQSVTGGKVITDPNTLEQVSANAGSDQLIEVPIRVREQVIGVLNIRAATSERDLRPDDMNIVNAVVERLGLALDNARLFEETSSRASRERLVTDITTKIRGSNDPEEMIKTAVEELKQALGVSRVEILPKKINPSPDV